MKVLARNVNTGQYVIFEKKGRTIWSNALRPEDVKRWESLIVGTMTYYKSFEDIPGQFEKVAIINNPNRPRRSRRPARGSRKRPVRNPREVLIYENIGAIVASKKGMPHRCDAECKAADHNYIHEFKKGSGIFGVNDGSINVRRKRR